jgi:ABC-type nitrate/sulfonate/bicarbonate transport system permease component
VGVGVLLGLSLGLTLALGPLVLALGEALALGLVVLPLLWLPLDEVAGAVVLSLVLLAALVFVSVADGCVDADGQELGVVWTVTP